MSNEFQPSRFRHLNDPTVVTRPFSVIVDGDKCIGCGVCIKQCPCQTLEMAPRKEASVKQQPSCAYHCPAGTDIRACLQILSTGGNIEDAWRIITDMNPMPAVTGRVCPHPCEGSCNRQGVDSAVNIHGIERFVGDYALEKGLAFEKPVRKKDGKVAVVGAGPSGMSCAYQLARMGYRVTVFDSAERPGGMLMHAIPRYRLPEAVVEQEVKRIVDLGLTMKLGVSLGRDITLDSLKKEFSAVYVAPGAQESMPLRIEGEDAGRIYHGLDFLRSAKENRAFELGKDVAVIGSGNTAIDAARIARRMGSSVTVYYRRTEADMPAHKDEIQAAREEGVKIEFLCAPVAFSVHGKARLTCRRMEQGEPDESGRPRPVPIKGSCFEVAADTLIAAVGQALMHEGLEGILESSWVGIDAMGRTRHAGVFGGGDAASGAGLVSEAIGAGRKAALAVDAFLSGKDISLPEKKEICYRDIPLNHIREITRNEAKGLPVAGRLKQGDAEVNLSLGREGACSESGRCLKCGMSEPKFTGQEYFGNICIACHSCESICPQGAVSFPNFYRVNQGRWAYDFDYPETGKGIPNPLMLEQPLPLAEIESRLTDVEKVIYKRRSLRVYKPDPVPKEMIHRVIEAGRFAPSAGNCQGWKFVVVTDRKLLDGLSASTIRFLGLFTRLYQGRGPARTMLKKSLALIKPNSVDQRPMCAIQALLTPKFGEGGKLDCFFNAPAAIFLVTHRLHISEPELGMGICGQNMVLAAHSLGLGTCYVGFVSNALNLDPVTKTRFRKRLGIEWPYDSVATVITIGYPAVPSDKPVDREIPRIQWVE